MKKLVILLFVSLLTFSGCDMFRKLAGRPTSEDIEMKRLEIKKNRARLDSLDARRIMQADSLAMVDSVRQMSNVVRSISEFGGLMSGTLDTEYYIIVGSFMKKSNVERMKRNVEEAGYSCEIIKFRNGFTAVAVKPSDASSVYITLKRIRKEPFCPDDVWVLVNE